MRSGSRVWCIAGLQLAVTAQGSEDPKTKTREAAGRHRQCLRHDIYDIRRASPGVGVLGCQPVAIAIAGSPGPDRMVALLINIGRIWWPPQEILGEEAQARTSLSRA
jgi:hypothetical protein